MPRPFHNSFTRRGLYAGGLLALVAGGCQGQTQPFPSALEPALVVPRPMATSPASLALPANLEPLPPVWERLRQADERLYVVLLRHAIAPGTGDPDQFRLDDCSTQRNLSAAGRSQAQQIGAAFRRRGIAVEQVLSSEWCRCLETAALMDLGPVESYSPLNSFFRDRRTAEQQTTQVLTYLQNQPGQGVIVMVTHQVNITALTGVVPSSGQAVVVTLADGNQLAQVGLLAPVE